MRMLWLAPTLTDWLDEDLFPARRRGRQPLTPFEQVEDLFDSFVGDTRYSGVGDFQNIKPGGDGVYEIKTPCVRVFGWFPLYRGFVAVCAQLKDRLDTAGYDRCRRDTVAFRRGLGLPQPDFIRGQGHVSRLL